MKTGKVEEKETCKKKNTKKVKMLDCIDQSLQNQRQAFIDNNGHNLVVGLVIGWSNFLKYLVLIILPTERYY